MSQMPALNRLRRMEEVDPDEIWRRIYTTYAAKTDYSGSTEQVFIPTQPWSDEHKADAKASGEQKTGGADVALTVSDTLREVYALLNAIDRGEENQHQGWYVVANFSDPLIALNDQPGATYKGTTMLTAVPNGAVLWISSATGYNGLRNSPGCWGETSYNGQRGFVPMNLLVKLKLD